MVDDNGDSEVASLFKEIQRKMTQVVENFSNELRGVRSGRVSPSFLDSVKVDAYGSMVGLSQVASANVSDAQSLLIQIWDASLAGAVEKAIRLWDSDLGIEAAGQSLRVKLPPMTEQRRQDLVKIVAKMSENAKISVRSCRKEALEGVRSLEKNKIISEDERHTLTKKVQKITDKATDDIDASFAKKKSDITSIGV